jgi:hypothetical protein
MSEEPEQPDEPVWRARARIGALIVLSISLGLECLLPPVEPGLLLGTIVALGALVMRRPLGIAVVAVRALVELAYSLSTLREFGPLAATFHAASALGLGALAWVLYQSSPHAEQERRWTLGGVAMWIVGTLGFATSALLPLWLDPENEPGTATQLVGHQAAYTIDLPSGSWRIRRQGVCESLGLDAWAIRGEQGTPSAEELSVRVRMGLPSGEEGLTTLSEDDFGESYRELVREEHRWLLHAQQVTEFGVAPMTCILTNEHGIGIRACAFAAQGATAERLAELQASLATLRFE